MVTSKTGLWEYIFVSRIINELSDIIFFFFSLIDVSSCPTTFGQHPKVGLMAESGPHVSFNATAALRSGQLLQRSPCAVPIRSHTYVLTSQAQPKKVR